MTEGSVHRPYTRFSRLNCGMAAGVFFFIFSFAWPFLGFHIDSFLISGLVAVGVFLLLSRSRKKSDFHDWMDAVEGAEGCPIPANFSEWTLVHASVYLKSRVGSAKLSRKNRDLLYQILEDAQWVAFRSELSIDHPEHRATVDLVV